MVDTLSTDKGIDRIFIAKWYDNKDAAVSLRFDDACETHVNVAIPVLNRYGIKGTFMVNPGRASYQNHKQFWETDVPGMGHDLGNHTWNHHGAKTLEEADFEIGAVSRLLWETQPEKSKLLVFASGGGGKKWGGKHWRIADGGYKQLIDKYHLIDLYDGRHPYYSADSKATVSDMCDAVRQAIDNKAHQAYAFHRIANPARTLKGLARLILRGYDITFSEKDFSAFVAYLDELEDQLWTASLIDILKYETERQGAKLFVSETQETGVTVQLKLQTDSALYDHPLTMVSVGMTISRILQRTVTDTREVEWVSKDDHACFQIAPVDSRIDILMK